MTKSTSRSRLAAAVSPIAFSIALAAGGGTAWAQDSAVTEAEQAAQAAQQAVQSVREIYRKLVSALHPDRAIDAAEHTRKTVLRPRSRRRMRRRRPRTRLRPLRIKRRSRNRLS